MSRHTLKIDPKWYDAVANGIKTFEARKNDRGFKVGDTLHLREYRGRNSEGYDEFTGRSCEASVTYILQWYDFSDAIAHGYVVLGIRIEKVIP